MTALHTEKVLEGEICRDLAAARWLHDAADAARYDRALALYPDDVVGWIQTTQPEAWASIEHTHGANARKVVCERLRRTLADHGTLHVLRQGFVVPRKNDARQLVNTIFPHYHQLDATRAIAAAVRRDGPGDKYLIQHSAGSGKTNSIAWTAHFLAEALAAGKKIVVFTQQTFPEALDKVRELAATEGKRFAMIAD